MSYQKEGAALGSGPTERQVTSKTLHQLPLAQQARAWREVSRQEPCPVCEKDSWCSASTDGALIACRRTSGAAAERRTDKSGAEFWLHKISGSVSLPRRAAPAREPERAASDTLHEVYSALLEELPLWDAHRENLRTRKLSDADTERGGYRSFPFDSTRYEIADRLVKRFGLETCLKVPGFYRQSSGKSGDVLLAGAAGMLIPVRDTEGRISALKIRADEIKEGDARYTYLSSSSRGGVGPGSPAHTPLFESGTGGEMRITEGELKADASTVLSGVRTLSFPGVASWRTVLPALKRFEAKTVRLAFDRDAETNPHVGRALRQCFESLRADGYRVLIEAWPAPHKGIDDALAAGVQIRSLEGDAAKAYVSRAAGEPTAAEAPEWESPVPLEAPPLKAFPLDGLPDWLGRFVRELATATETPPELPALMALATVSTCAARVFQVQVKPGYREPVNIWACIALEPGNRKSAVVSECTAPLAEWQSEQADYLAPQIKEAFSHRKSEEAFITGLRGKLGKVQDDVERRQSIEQIAQLEAKLPEIPRAPQLWGSDVTPEKLGILMAENGERMALLSDEGGIFDGIAGRYSGVPNLDLFLKAHAGTAERVDRASRGPVILKSPALTMGVSPQPSVLQAIAGMPGFRGRGLLARFLFALPRSLLGERSGEAPPVSEATRSAYRDGIRALLRQSFNVDCMTLREGETLTLSPEAFEHWRSFSREIEPRLKEGADLYPVKDWAGKVAGAAARIAGLLHVSKYAHESPGREPIGSETMLHALSIADALTAHALAVFGFMGADADLEAAKVILRWIQRKGHQEFSQRACHKGLHSRFHRVEELRAALNVLVERGYLREPPPAKTAYRPTIRFQVNPKALEESSC